VALTPEADRTPDREADPVHDAKRWRLSRALAVALGRVHERSAIPDLMAAMEAGCLYFPALAQVPLALARLDASEALPLLERLWHYAEVNTERHIQLAARYLRGELTRAELERLANPG
jgi:HEAT repeat protein